MGFRQWLGLGALAVLVTACQVGGGWFGEGARSSAAGHPAYRPALEVTSPIRIWGSPDDRQLLESLQAGFRSFHPGARFENGLHGPESAFAGIYTDVADLALMARELREPLERMAYQWVKLGRPVQVEIARAGLRPGRLSSQLAVMVHRDNPLPDLTLAELDALLGAERRRGGSEIVDWSDLGVADSPASGTIRIYGPRVDSLAAKFIRRTVMQDSRKWRPDYREVEDGSAIVDLLAADVSGLAIAPAWQADERVRVVAAAADDEGAAFLPEAGPVSQGSYPLTRSISVAFAHSLAQPTRGHAIEFLRFVLSREGQEILARDGAYLPLSADHAADMLARLGDPRAEPDPVADRDHPTDEGLGELRPTGPEQVGLQAHELPPAYRPRSRVEGRISIWGHGSYGAHTDFVEGLTRAWQDGFREHHPGVRFENRLHGTASAIGALYTGTGDVAFLGREIWESEIAAFTEVRGYAPTGVDVLTGSFDVRNKGYAISVFVHRDNPIRELDLAQLEAVFGVDRTRGHAAVRTWGDLGLTGEWRDRPVRPYGLPIARGFALYFQDAVFQGARKWKPGLREFPDAPGSRGGETDGGHRMLEAMAADPFAIGYAGMLYRHPDVKAIALAPAPGEPAVMPSLQSVADRSYPLTRTITMFVDRPPGEPLDPKVREFMQYILSREGQQAVLDHGQGYLPVPADVAAREARKLD